MGIVEGITEFLPISSTFHLIWTGQLMGLENSEFLKLFEVFIQSGAVLAVLLLYLKSLVKDFNLIKKLIISFLPTASVGFIFYKLIKSFFFENLWLQLAVFALVGIVFILFEKSKYAKNLKRNIEDMSYKEALIVGFLQALAVIPGVSRAGAVIVGMMGIGVKREEAARYSFLLALPTLFIASAYDLYKSRDLLSVANENVAWLALGFVAAFLSALLVVKWFINYLRQHSLAAFGYYRLVLAAVFFLWLIFAPY